MLDRELKHQGRDGGTGIMGEVIDHKNYRCLACGDDLKGKPIPQEYIDKGYYQEGATHYSNIIGVEYPYGHPDRYDGISEWRCPACGAREGRWSGKTLAEGETEPRRGGNCLRNSEQDQLPPETQNPSTD